MKFFSIRFLLVAKIRFQIYTVPRDAVPNSSPLFFVLQILYRKDFLQDKESGTSDEESDKERTSKKEGSQEIITIYLACVFLLAGSRQSILCSLSIFHPLANPLFDSFVLHPVTFPTVQGHCVAILNFYFFNEITKFYFPKNL